MKPLFRCRVSCGALPLALSCGLALAQGVPNRQTLPAGQNPAIQAQDRDTRDHDDQAEKELQAGTTLTRRGEFSEAIPHLLAARGRVANDYAAGFNLALCYVATDQPRRAIPVLTDLRNGGHDNADVNNLLAQAYVGDSQNEKALEALQRAASSAPANERLYMFVADACMGKQNYGLGIQVVDLGLKSLPNAARLHFERGMFLTLLDRFDDSKSDFDLARKLAPDSDVAFVAGAQEAMLGGNIDETIRIARDGLQRGHTHFLLLTLLGEALLRSGVVPGQPEFTEARLALEKSVADRPNYSSSQLALGKLYLMDNQFGPAVVCLEKARQLNPGNASVYSNLATAYRKQGDVQKAQEALATLAKLNEAQAEKIRSAPGDRKTSYAGPTNH